MTEQSILAALTEMKSAYYLRSPYSRQDELVVVLPRWMWDRYGQERLTASIQRVGIEHVKIVEDWSEAHEANPQVLLYAAGTWHTNHHIGQTSPDCEGCQYHEPVLQT